MKPLIVMQSDFGIGSGFVSCMHGICKIVDPELQTCDITHLLPPFNVEAASFCLQYTVPCWPEGTIFVSVVDPGVGTERRACVAKLKNGSFVVTPDNGALTYLDEMIGVEEIREIDEKINRYPRTMEISIFHGRDLFAYCAARLASGIITYEEVGPMYPTDEIVRHRVGKSEVSENCIKAEIQGFDPFGSVGTSVRNSDLSKAGFVIGDQTEVTLLDGQEEIFRGMVPYEKSFGFVEKGSDVLFNGLTSFATIGTNEGSFAGKNDLCADKSYRIVIEKIG